MRASRAASLLLAGLLATGLAACENGPKMADLAPKIPNLDPEIPETRHPDKIKAEYPNINFAPDRPSTIRSDDEREEIEKSLEAAGDAHVKETVGKITGKPPQAAGGNGQGEKSAAPADTGATDGDADKPIQLIPPDNPS